MDLNPYGPSLGLGLRLRLKSSIKIVVEILTVGSVNEFPGRKGSEVMAPDLSWTLLFIFCRSTAIASQRSQLCCLMLNFRLLPWSQNKASCPTKKKEINPIQFQSNSK